MTNTCYKVLFRGSCITVGDKKTSCITEREASRIGNFRKEIESDYLPESSSKPIQLAYVKFSYNIFSLSVFSFFFACIQFKCVLCPSLVQVQ
jgi:hypothetical protein